MFVGITLRPRLGPDHPPLEVQNRAYIHAIETAGGTPLPIPLIRDPDKLRELYDLCGALVLPGGPDVEPKRYGATLREDCNVKFSRELDEVELRLARWAVDDGLPLLAICRGIQVLNVASGGTLWQDVQVERVVEQTHDRGPRDSPVHEVSVESDSLLAHTIGRTRIRVNSLHHQAIRELGDSLRAVAVSSDGLVEAVEMPGRRFIIGVQCHPEELSGKEEWAAALFKALVSAAKELQPA